MKKTYNIEKSLEHFAYRLKHGRYEPNQNDVDALVFLVDWVNREKAKQLKQNALFAKLFCLVFAQEVKFYDGDFAMAQKKMHDYLKHPTYYYYEIFKKEIDDVALNKYLESIGVCKNLLLDSSEKQKKENKILEENWEEIEKRFNGSFDEDKVRISLNNTISEFINLYKSIE